MEERKVLRAGAWSKLGSVFGFILAGLWALFTVALATPFFLLSLLFNWIKAGIGLSLFWFIACCVYATAVKSSAMANDPTGFIFNDTSLLIIVAVSFIVALIATINGD